VPLYEYECDACGRRFEVIQKYSDPSVDVCKHCGKGPVRRLLSSPAIQFKGSGWYITDYAKKGKSDATTPSGKTDGAKSDTSGDSAARSDTAAKGDSAKGDSAKSDSASTASTSKE
jgi:putative FmdB family regulatory protein